MLVRHTFKGGHELLVMSIEIDAQCPIVVGHVGVLESCRSEALSVTIGRDILRHERVD